MFNIPEDSVNNLNDDEAFGLLQEMEANTSDELRRQRTHFRIAIKAGVILRAGNSRDLITFKLKGVTGDISEGGCSVLFPLPTHVGDVYRLEFDRQAIHVPLTFARCVRCRLIREDAFEAGFSFFNAIALPEHIDEGAEMLH